MVLTIEQAQSIIDMLGLVWGYCWYALDHVQLVTYMGQSYSILDAFCIAGAVIDIAWELIEELRS